jgi:hypothetical protein
LSRAFQRYITRRLYAWNRVDSRLLVVGNQTINLTPILSFGHNLCFRCPNGRCKHISDIYVSISFQWYKKLFNAMGFDPCNCALKVWESNSQHGSSLGSVRVHSLTLFALLGACDLTLKFFFWPATLQPLALVSSPRLGLGHLLIVIFNHVQQNSTCFFPIMLSRLCIVMKAKYPRLLGCYMQLLMEFNEASLVLINFIPCLFFTDQGLYHLIWHNFK